MKVDEEAVVDRVLKFLEVDPTRRRRKVRRAREEECGEVFEQRGSSDPSFEMSGRLLQERRSHMAHGAWCMAHEGAYGEWRMKARMVHGRMAHEDAHGA